VSTAHLAVAPDDPTPPYEQLRRQFVDLIGGGVLGGGERLPPVRQLAADLGVAVGTVARTYRELEQAGLVVTRRGGGTRVRRDPPTSTPADLERELDAAAEALVRQARLLGADGAGVRAAVERALTSDAAGTVSTARRTPAGQDPQGADPPVLTTPRER
jgi:DNA-binding transcriptional regulator YhcF (GntR family)